MVDHGILYLITANHVWGWVSWIMVDYGLCIFKYG